MHDVRNGLTTIDVDGVQLPLDVATAQTVLRGSDRPELAPTEDPHENDGPEVPFEDRHEQTPDKLRRRVLWRDRHRCRCCGSRANLTVHHKKWRRYGGRTVARNLLTLCEHCHSLVHARLLLIRGTIEGGLLFLDARGRELEELERPVQEMIRGITVELDATADARASGLDDLIGQKTAVRNLRRAVRAAMQQW